MKGALLAQLGRTDEARAAFDRAIALARTPRRGRACSNAV
jgi:predicted RNA polymerase sigma factor